MGLYIEVPSESQLETRITYKHHTGNWYLYYYKPNKFWFVGSKVGKRSGWLYVQSEESTPVNVNKAWKFWNDSTKEWLTDPNLFCIEAASTDAKGASGSSEQAAGQTRSARLRRDSGVPQLDSSEERDEEDACPLSQARMLFEETELEGSWFAAVYQLYSVEAAEFSEAAASVAKTDAAESKHRETIAT